MYHSSFSPGKVVKFSPRGTTTFYEVLFIKSGSRSINSIEARCSSSRNSSAEARSLSSRTSSSAGPDGRGFSSRPGSAATEIKHLIPNRFNIQGVLNRFNIQGVSKNVKEGSTDSCVIGFSRLRPF